MTEAQLIARKEKHKIQNREYYQRNRERILQQRLGPNGDLKRSRDRSYYYDHKQVILAQRKRLYEQDKLAGRAKHKRLSTILSKAKLFARYRGLEWSITLDQLEAIRSKPCTYCGGSLPQFAPGLDRIDNDIGYRLDNVLPCCGDCNRHRGRTWTVEETRAAVSAVMNLRKTKCQ